LVARVIPVDTDGFQLLGLVQVLQNDLGVGPDVQRVHGLGEGANPLKLGVTRRGARHHEQRRIGLGFHRPVAACPGNQFNRVGVVDPALDLPNHRNGWAPWLSIGQLDLQRRIDLGQDGHVLRPSERLTRQHEGAKNGQPTKGGGSTIHVGFLIFAGQAEGVALN
jgi:hypothetical protein